MGSFVFLEVAGHIYYTHSSGTLPDWELLAFALDNAGSLGGVVGSEMPRYGVVTFIVAPALLLGAFFLRPWKGNPTRSASRLRRSRTRFWCTLGGSVLGFLGACAPGVYHSDIGMVRDLALSTTVSAFQGWSEPQYGAEKLDFPTEVVLEPRVKDQSPGLGKGTKMSP